MKQFIIVFWLGMILSGCAQMNSDFDCPMKPGVRCESIDSVNDRVTRGDIGPDGIHSSRAQPSQNTTIKNSTLSGSYTYTSMRDGRTSSINRGEPLRYGETVMRIWISPFEDTEGNYHQESTLYSVIKPGTWIGQP